MGHTMHKDMSDMGGSHLQNGRQGSLQLLASTTQRGFLRNGARFISLMHSGKASSNSLRLQHRKFCVDVRDELFARRLGMCWRRPKAGSWTAGPPEVVSRPQYSEMLCHCYLQG